MIIKVLKTQTISGKTQKKGQVLTVTGELGRSLQDIEILGDGTTESTANKGLMKKEKMKAKLEEKKQIVNTQLK